MLGQGVGESLEFRDILTHDSELVRGALFENQETALLTERQRERRCAVADEPANRPLLDATAGESFRFYLFSREHDPDAPEDTGASRMGAVSSRMRGR